MYSPSLPLQNPSPIYHFSKISSNKPFIYPYCHLLHLYSGFFKDKLFSHLFLFIYIYTHASANYTSKKATSVSPLESEDLGTKGTDGVNSSPKGRGEINVAAQTGRQDTRVSSFLFPVLFYSGPQQPGQCHPHWGRQSTLPSPPIQMLILSSRNTITNTHPKIFNLGTRCYINLNITHFTLTLVP